MTGGALSRCAEESNPCRAAYISYLGGPNLNRPSWDLLVALAAVRGVSAAHVIIVPGIGLWSCWTCWT